MLDNILHFLQTGSRLAQITLTLYYHRLKLLQFAACHGLPLLAASEKTLQLLYLHQFGLDFTLKDSHSLGQYLLLLLLTRQFCLQLTYLELYLQLVSRLHRLFPYLLVTGKGSGRPLPISFLFFLPSNDVSPW